MRDGFFAALVGNALYAAGATHYWYVVFSGYLVLPFVQRPNLLLTPVAVICLGLLIATAVQVNVPRLLLGIYVS
jgi:hypothetical protein